MALSRELRLNILLAYGDGRLTVDSVADVVKGYRGRRRRHPLWEVQCPFYIYDCFEHLSEAKMVELLRAMVAVDPDFPLLRSPRNSKGCSLAFLHAAFVCARCKQHDGLDPNEGNTAYNVLRWLMVPGITRMYSSTFEVADAVTPLQMASEIPGLDPAVLHRLIDLDSGSILDRWTGAFAFAAPRRPAVLDARRKVGRGPDGGAGPPRRCSNGPAADLR